jgi:hypothetical protein
VLRSADARLLTNLGNVLVASGDEVGGAQLYANAVQLDGALAAAHFNLAQLHRRRSQVVEEAGVVRERLLADEALSRAQALDASLVRREPPGGEPPQMNRFLVSPPLSQAALDEVERGAGVGAAVEAQLAQVLLGTAPDPLAFAAPALAALLGLGLAGLRRALGASKVCERCGRPVCRRCDRELGVGSAMCQQCINVFARKAVVVPRAKVLKQLEIERGQQWQQRASCVLGVLVGGAGHLFVGRPVRGALYAFVFLFAVFGLLTRHGVLRAPWAEVPLVLKLAPVGLVLLGLYVLSLRGLLRRPSR